MATISQVSEFLLAVVIFVIIVFIFNQMYGPSECESFANTTAMEITSAINNVAEEKGVTKWTGDGVPPDEEKNSYIAVPVRLCERNPISNFLATFSAQTPEYIITYERFPEGGFAWSESQPFSGGALSSFENFVMMKVGTKILSKGLSFGWKITSGVTTSWYKGSWSLVKFKIQNAWDKFRNNRIITAILGESESALNGDVTDLPLSRKYLANKNLPSGIRTPLESIADNAEAIAGNDVESIVDLGIVKSSIDSATGEWGPTFDRQHRFIVKPEFAEVINFYTENAGDQKNLYKQIFYVPSRFEKIEKLKEFWRPYSETIKGWVENRWIYQKIQVAKIMYSDMKNGWNKVANNENYLDEFEVPAGTEIYKASSIQDLSDFRVKAAYASDQVLKTLRDITGETFDSIDEVSDLDLIKFISSSDRYFESKSLMGFLARDENIVDASYLTLGKKYSDLVDAVINAPDSASALNSYQELRLMAIGFDNLDQVEKVGIIDDIERGFSNTLGRDSLGEAANVYEEARAIAISEGMFVKDDFFDSSGNLVRGDLLVERANEIKSKLIQARIEQPSFNKANYFLTPIIDPANIKKFQASTYFFKTLKRQFFLELPRVGQGIPIPGTSAQISIAPYQIIPGAYDAQQSLEGSSEGCTRNSICKIMRGKSQGAAEGSSTPYLLDKQVSNFVVKLWRPKPALTSRFPIFISTALLYASVPENPRFYLVSPCYGFAKVWKDRGGTIFVSVDKGKKCDVSGCEQPHVTISTGGTYRTPSQIPLVGWSIPSFSIALPDVKTTLGPSNIDTPNYCYADAEYIWGNDLGSGGDEPNTITSFTLYGLCAGGCTLASQGSQFHNCLKGCSYAGMGVLLIAAFAKTQDYRNVPTWQRQETGWGYWNYQKANDICSILDLISSFGGKGGEPNKISAWLSRRSTVKAVSKQLNVGDMCFFITLMGDASLSWPTKVPLPEVWKKAGTLNEKCISEQAGTCSWFKKCAEDSDCSQALGEVCDKDTKMCAKGCDTQNNPCPSGLKCSSNGVCIRQ